MSTISLRLPDSLHKQGRKLAQKESVSINQLTTLALTVCRPTVAARLPTESRAGGNTVQRVVSWCSLSIGSQVEIASPYAGS